jgi:UDP-N-acetylglucosamine 1-carboxyvinyltransferase
MGVTISVADGYINASAKKRLKACEFSFIKPSVGATINAILAAVLADGTTKLSNCAREPEITDLCECLIKMGAEISGLGRSEIIIEGKVSLNGCEHRVIPDRIEAGTYMIATAMTKGDTKIHGINYDLVENLAIRMKESGVNISHSKDIIHVSHKGPIKSIDISTGPYPAFSTDLQAQFMSLMTIANGSSIISENIFENRFMHVPELCRMGANITINGHSAVIRGVSNLSGAEIMASDLRASVSLVIAGLAANGDTKIRRIYHLDRGYETIEKKLSACGASIKRISGDSV